MQDVIKLFASEYSGGTIKLYNLFNLKNQHSSEAAEQFSANQAHTRMFAKDQEIKFCHAPVIIASGNSVIDSHRLKQELIRYISLANVSNLYRIAKVGDNKVASLALRLSPWQDHRVLRRKKTKSASYA